MTREPLLPAILLVGVVLVAAPYCGMLFRCGCSWPWAGLVEHCNFFDPQSLLRCPWCEHPVAAILSIATAVAAGLWSAQRPTRAFPVRVLHAIAAFFLTAAVAGCLTAAVTGYPWPA